MKAIVGKQARDLAPGLLAFLSGTRQAEPSGEILRGAAGELCVLPDTRAGDAGSDLCPWTEIRLAGDTLEVEGGAGFRVVRTP